MDHLGNPLKPPSLTTHSIDDFEADLTFLGLTAVEDTLQWQAEDTLKMIRKAGIRTWICTGDKF